MTKRVIEEAGTDGIYLSVQNVQSSTATKEAYQNYIAPSELAVLAEANKVSDYNILHICGYEHHQNDLSYYWDYEAKAYNWAVHTEKISLKEGKDFFGNKAVIGGFDNNTGTLLDSGNKADIARFTVDIIHEIRRYRRHHRSGLHCRSADRTGSFGIGKANSGRRLRQKQQTNEVAAKIKQDGRSGVHQSRSTLMNNRYYF